MDASISQSVAAFHHDTLPDAARYMRLLEVLSDNHSEDIKVRCRITTWPIDNIPPYRAISYTWGDPESNTTILINDRAFRVRTNCEFVLKQAYWYEKTYYYWVDAICINQESLEEKSMQVSIMGSIYKRAAHVLACVGDHADDSAFLFHKLKQRAFTERLFRTNSLALSSTLSLRFQLGNKFSTTVRFLQAVAPFIERPYFTRLWILQELRNAKEATFLCGSDAIPRRAIFDMTEGIIYIWYSMTGSGKISPVARMLGIRFRLLWSRWSGKFSLVATNVARRFPLFRRLWTVQEYWWNFLNMSEEGIDIQRTASTAQRLVDTEADLRTLLTAAYFLQCQERKDKIFGLISLIDWGPFALVVPDYTQTEFEIAVTLFQAFLELGQCDSLREQGIVFDLLELDVKSNGVPSAIESRRVEPRTTLAGAETAVELAHSSRYEFSPGWRVSSGHLTKHDLGFVTWSTTGSDKSKVYLPSWVNGGDWIVSTGWHRRCVVVREAAEGSGGRLIGHTILGEFDTREVAHANFGIHWDPEDLVIFDLVQFGIWKLAEYSIEWVNVLHTAICKRDTPASSYAVRWDDVS